MKFSIIIRRNNFLFCSNGGLQTCLSCQEGTYSTTNGSESCVVCPEGSECPTKTDEPVECGAGFYRYYSKNIFICAAVFHVTLHCCTNLLLIVDLKGSLVLNICQCLSTTVTARCSRFLMLLRINNV